jgi:hypothetical protein
MTQDRKPLQFGLGALFGLLSLVGMGLAGYRFGLRDGWADLVALPLSIWRLLLSWHPFVVITLLLVLIVYCKKLQD